MTDVPGLTNLISLATATYMGFVGGLYPGGSNTMPTAHFNAASRQVLRVVPRNAAGEPDVEGKIGFLSIGPSYLVGAFTLAQIAMNADPLKNPAVVVVNGAQAGMHALEISNPASPYWAFVDSQIAAAGLTNAQVQTIWFEEANEFPAGGFPAEALTLQAQFTAAMQNIRTRYVNARLAYVQCRAFAGNATTALNPEPYAYEQGFACKWLIEQQISGDPALTFGAPTPMAPWIGWGNYQWANGSRANPDGLFWIPSDFSSGDGTHLSPAGAAKVASRILLFVQTDAIASQWYQ